MAVSSLCGKLSRDAFILHWEQQPEPAPPTQGLNYLVEPRQKSAMLRAVSMLISGHALGKTSTACVVPSTCRQHAGTPAAKSIGFLRTMDSVRLVAAVAHIVMQKTEGGTTTTVPVPDHRELRIGTLLS